MEKVDEILNNAKIPDRHSFFQIEKFMIGKEPTAQAQYWAIVRELEARKETVQSYKKDLADAEDNLELFDVRIERLDLEIQALKTENDPHAALNIREREINIRKLQREKEALVAAARKANKKLRHVQEEMAYLAAGHDKIVKLYGPMKPLDDEAAQQEMWNEKLLEEFNLRVILQRPLDPEFIKTVMCLHHDAPVKKHVAALLEGIQKEMIATKKQNAKAALGR
jgi:predicted  nucleic acid-binding Zn-ribbon protein